jgi:hypothetical protein
LIYAYFVEHDAEMTIADFHVKDVKHCKVRNFNMIEELA